MSVELRPLRLGELLDRTFHLYRARFMMFLGIAALSTLLETAWSVLQIFEARLILRLHPVGAIAGLINSISAILAWAISFASAAIVVAAINRAVTDIYDGKGTGIVQSFRQIRMHWLRCVWINLLAFFIAWSPVVLVVLSALGAILLAIKAKTQMEAHLLTVIYGGAGLIALCAFPFCVWLTLRYSLAVPACVHEKIGPLKSLKRSVFLSRETRWRILLLLAIVACAQFILVLAFTAPAFAILARTPGHIPVAIHIYILAVAFLAGTFIKPIYGIGLTLFYFDSRVRKEGFDIERMMEQTLGMATTPTLFGAAPKGQMAE